MADSKLTALTATTTPASTDITYVVTTPGGTPASKKVTNANLITKAHGLSDGIVKVSGGTMAPAVANTDYLPVASPTATGTATLPTVNQTTNYTSEINDGNSGTTKTIDWTTGNHHLVTMTGNCTFTFTAPTGYAHLTMRMVQDGTGGRTVTWPAAVKWPEGVQPTWNTGASKVNLVMFIYDGTNYNGGGLTGMG